MIWNIAQAEILKYTESIKVAVSARQISIAINADISRVCHALKQLIKFNEINFVELDRTAATKYLDNPKIHRRTKVYFSLGVPENLALADLKADLG